MKRDMDLVRDLLLRIEAGENAFNTMSQIVAANMGFKDGRGLQQTESDMLDHHLWLLESSELVTFRKTGDGIWYPVHITWTGHDFLDSVRDPEIWQKTKDGAKAAGGFTVELLGDLAKGLIKTQIKKVTGVDI